MNHLENCKLALQLWQERVTPEMVNLDTWSSYGRDCGTQACFGGWLATWPEFQAMGITQCPANTDNGNYRGEPLWFAKDLTFGIEVGKELFGTSLFAGRVYICHDDDTAEDPELSDYELVVDRLEKQIALLEQENGAVRK